MCIRNSLLWRFYGHPGLRTSSKIFLVGWLCYLQVLCAHSLYLSIQSLIIKRSLITPETLLFLGTYMALGHLASCTVSAPFAFLVWASPDIFGKNFPTPNLVLGNFTLSLVLTSSQGRIISFCLNVIF